MPITVQLKRIAAAVLALGILFSTTAAYSQDRPMGREYERSRVASVPSLTAGYAGGEMMTEYRIMPGDVIEITVWREPELTRNVRVRPDGQFSYPLIGTIRAAGRTIDELQDTMRTELLKYIKYPEVTCSIIESAGSVVLVLGEVLYPGLYSYRGQGDVLTAIALAGDFIGTAKRESVIVISGNFTDHPKARRVNVFRSFYHGTPGTNALIKPGDVVYVPRTFIADWNKTLNDLQPTINTALSAFRLRSDFKTVYYNRDKPVKASAD